MAREKFIHLDMGEVIQAGAAGAAFGVMLASKVRPDIVPPASGTLGRNVGAGITMATLLIRDAKRYEAEHEAKKP